jgi:spore coat protein U-like protein
MKAITMILMLSIVFLMAPRLHAAFCNINTTPISFGNYDVFSTNPLASTGSISIWCRGKDHKNLPLTISISSGGSGSFCPRKMRNSNGGADSLDYNIFTDAAMTTVWGDGSGCTTTVPTITTGNGNLDSILYGGIPGGQDVAAGAYSDTVTVTVMW